MKVKTWRFVLLLAAILLAGSALERTAHAFAEPCPPFPFIGPESIQEGCCLDLTTKKATLQYYSYMCVDGVPEDSTRICAATPCNL